MLNTPHMVVNMCSDRTQAAPSPHIPSAPTMSVYLSTSSHGKLHVYMQKVHYAEPMLAHLQVVDVPIGLTPLQVFLVNETRVSHSSFAFQRCCAVLQFVVGVPKQQHIQT